MGRRGLTLIEVVLVAALAGLVGLALVVILGPAHTYLVQEIGISLSQGDSSYATEHMTRSLWRANRMRQFGGTKLAFRYDNLWAGYRLNGTTLEFLSDIKTGEDLTEGEFNDAFNTKAPLTIAQDLLPPGGAVPSLFELNGARTAVDIDLTVRKPAGAGSPRDTRLRTTISPRGIAGP